MSFSDGTCSVLASGDAVIPGRLAIGQNCPLDASLPPMYVNGDTRIDGSTLVYDLHFTAGAAQSAAYFAAAQEASGVIAVRGGGLRIDDTLQIGVPAADTHLPQSALTVRGDPAGAALLQAWQTNQDKQPVTAVAIDALGRLGLGTTSPTASLSISGTYRHMLEGTISGKANLNQFTGVATRFQEQLSEGDHLSIPVATPTTYRVVQIDPKDQKMIVDPTPDFNFSGSGYVDGPVLSAENGAGESLLSVDRHGALWVSGSLTGSALTCTSATVNGPLTTSGQMQANADASVAGTLQVTGQTNLTGPVQALDTLHVRGNFTSYTGWDMWSLINQGAHFTGHNGSMYMGWLPSFNEAQLTFKISDSSGQIGYSGSSRKDKDAIAVFDTDFERVLQLEPKSFVYRASPSGPRSIGYIAEELDELGLQELVIYNGDGMPSAIRYDRIPLYHSELIKQLRSRVAALEEALGQQCPKPSPKIGTS